jgi:hypothetical protein
MWIASRVSLGAWRPVLGQHDSLLLGFGDAPVSDKAAGIELNPDLVLSPDFSSNLANEGGW